MSAKVRMYRQGLGDCFLVTLPRQQGRPYYILIDCGVIIGTPDGSARIRAVVEDVISTTEGRLDLLVVTHEHWDHVSGFWQARDLFANLEVEEVWVGWPEDPDDELAQALSGERRAMHAALAAAAARMRFAGRADATVDGLLELFGAAGRGTTREALRIAKELGKKPIRYCIPSDPPVEPQGTSARLYVLGPPHDEKMIKRVRPSTSRPETYDLAALAPTPADEGAGAPFDPIMQIPMDVARQAPFFRDHYWGEDRDSDEKDQSWRRIDASWLDASSSLALALDSATNNTSLVLAIELAGGHVLLFAADAQVGNWLSWQTCEWTVDGRKVTGPDLLRRTVLYKTGHHGSHNATLRDKGLEEMTGLKVALLPVDHDMAVKKGWLEMPLARLERKLKQLTGGRVLRMDRKPPEALSDEVRQDPAGELYYEVTVR